MTFSQVIRFLIRITRYFRTVCNYCPLYNNTYTVLYYNAIGSIQFYI